MATASPTSSAPVVDVRSPDGSTVGSVDLDPVVFGIRPNVPLMHQVVTGQLAAARAGTHSTKGRAEVRGGGAKPWRQKGTGRSRQGSSRSPQWTGGGVAMGPKPRSHRQKTPRKMIQLALRSALSDRAAEGRVVVVDRWTFQAPRTKEARAALSALGVDGRVLVVLGNDDHVAYRSFRNLPDVHPIPAGELNAYDVLCSDWVVFTSSTLPTSTPPSSSASTTETEPAGMSAGEGQVPEEPTSPPAAPVAGDTP
ncbi:MAG TPA: 50S ribosomal protein L4 [Acidimicrobiales bacterium]|nr:50S ribosomal protein L4 [Acidimicrobiales bacterium]